MSNLVTIKSSPFINDLSVAKSFLENDGVECFIENEHFVQVHPAGVMMELQVFEEDMEKAINLLLEGKFVTIDDYKEGYPDSLSRFVEKIISKFSGK